MEKAILFPAEQGEYVASQWVQFKAVLRKFSTIFQTGPVNRVALQGLPPNQTSYSVAA
jgi:hypothetical protein